MSKKILVVGLLLLVALFEGCVGQNSDTRTQVVGTNGTVIIEGSANSIFLQQGEKLYYVDGYYKNPDQIGDSIAKFTETHNVTKIEKQYKGDDIVGAYIIYR